jgi:hypothetical protein
VVEDISKATKTAKVLLDFGTNITWIKVPLLEEF